MRSLQYPLLILSDLHLGHAGSIIRHPEELGSLIRGHKTVVFNGDSSEQRCSILKERGTTLRDALIAVCAAEGCQPFFLGGNHDPVGVDAHYLDLPDSNLFITHGHALFPEVSPWSRELDASREAIQEIQALYGDHLFQDLDMRMEIATKISCAMEAIEFDLPTGVLGKLTTILKECWPPRRPLEILKIWATSHWTALDFLETYRPNSGCIIYGHTHRAGIWRRNRKLAINTGAFLPFMSPLAVRIDTETMSVFRINQNKAHFTVGERLSIFRFCHPSV